MYFLLKEGYKMSMQEFFPIVSNRLSTTFPELKHHILMEFEQTLFIKRGREIFFTKKNELLYLSKGKVKAYLYDQNGHERLMYLFLKDTIIFHSVSEQFCKKLIALEDATIYYVDKNSVFEFLQSDKSYIEKYTSLVAMRYGILMQQLLVSNHSCAKYKVLSFLYSLSRKFGEIQKDGTILISKFPSLTDIGALTDVHRTNVSAYVNELESLNIISRKDKALVINDIATLEKMLNDFSS